MGLSRPRIILPTDARSGDAVFAVSICPFVILRETLERISRASEGSVTDESAFVRDVKSWQALSRVRNTMMHILRDGK